MRESWLAAGGTNVAAEEHRFSSSVSGSVQQETKYLLPSLGKELFLAEPRDLEEGGLDLTVSLKPVSFYISDKKDMLQQCITGEQKLQKMPPDVLKARYQCGFYFNPEREQTTRRFGIKARKGEDSDVLSISANAYNSDIEDPSNEEAAASATAAPAATAASASEVPENTVQSEAAQIDDDLERDIEKSVNEILGLVESSPKEPKAAVLTVPPPEDVQPSAKQLGLLELEMRARAIKALMKAGDIKRPG